MPMNRLRNGYREFRNGDFVKEHELWSELAEGQRPDTLVIACADSRSDPAMIFNARPGELFVVRNVANLVPPYEPDGTRHGVSAAIEFAVKGLGVSNILVLGHRSCGGVNACAHGGAEDMEFVDPWLDTLRPAIAKANARADTDGTTLSDALELEGIGQSLANLMTFPFVRESVEAGKLTLNGARFGIAGGQLEWRKEDGTFEHVDVKR